MFDTLRNYIVKIGYDKKHAGSGVIIKGNNSSNSFYIFTAKHLFFDKSKEIWDMHVNDIATNKINIKNPCIAFKDDIKLELVEINNEYDFLIIQVSNCRIEENLPTNIFMDDMNIETNLSIMGFPHIRDKKKTEYDSYSCTYKHICNNEKHFEIDSKRILTVRDKEGNANHEISGLSGSGVYWTSINKEVSIVGILIESATGQGIVCFDLRKIIDEIHDKIDLVIPNKDEVLIEAKEKLTQPNKIFIDYINQKDISIEELLNACKSFLKPLEFTSIEVSAIEKIINYISDFDTFPCIINKLFNGDNSSDIEKWLLSKDIEGCSTIEDKESRISVLFKELEDKYNYEITIMLKDLSFHGNQNDSNKYDFSSDGKERFINKLIDYIKDEPNDVNIDLILPPSLMIENIKQWRVGRRDKLSKFSKINMRNIARYNLDSNIRRKVLKAKWSTGIKKHEDSDISISLYNIKEDSHIDNLSTNMNYCGIQSQYLLSKEDFKDILCLKLMNLNLIILWTTDENEGCLEWAETVKLPNLYDRFHSRDDFVTNQINLMWDDPTTYYYPNEN